MPTTSRVAPVAGSAFRFRCAENGHSRASLFAAGAAERADAPRSTQQSGRYVRSTHDDDNHSNSFTGPLIAFQA
jgi:hypothetical protein